VKNAVSKSVSPVNMIGACRLVAILVDLGTTEVVDVVDVVDVVEVVEVVEEGVSIGEE